MKCTKPTPEEIRDEDRKLRRLRFVVDLTTALLIQGDLTIPEAVKLIDNTKKYILNQFPDKEEAYDIIYKPRFERIIKESLERN